MMTLCLRAVGVYLCHELVADRALEVVNLALEAVVRAGTWATLDDMPECRVK